MESTTVSNFLDLVRRRHTQHDAEQLRSLWFNGDSEGISVALAPMVMSIAKRVYRSGCGCDIMDLVQAGQLAILTSAKSWKPGQGRSLSTYLYPSIRRDMVRELAFGRREYTTLDGNRDDGTGIDAGGDEVVAVNPKDALASEEPGPQRMLEIAEERLDLIGSIHALPPRQAEAMLMALDGMTQSEIAAEMGIGQGTVSESLKTAINNLQPTRYSPQ
jgi:RNA polymerase sigma factor (sigma-70 family)